MAEQINKDIHRRLERINKNLFLLMKLHSLKSYESWLLDMPEERFYSNRRRIDDSIKTINIYLVYCKIMLKKTAGEKVTEPRILCEVCWENKRQCKFTNLAVGLKIATTLREYQNIDKRILRYIRWFICDDCFLEFDSGNFKTLFTGKFKNS